MRLESIQLSGFKSFATPCTILLSTPLTAIVGPNGCGKSNIIDAVRWVLGESSARALRGENSEDILFNGCKTRKPVGQASVTLIFDNTETPITGQFASYTQIGIRRELTREGQSTYYLNGVRCRRRDIVSIFLGTGLGPNSYAILEQGMISDLIDAKPQEIYETLEEAAGISKYKERRHETQLRLAHTQTNLSRLKDLQQEIDQRLEQLQQQALIAQEYKQLKQQQRATQDKLKALQFNHLQQKIQSNTEERLAYETKIQTHEEKKRALIEQIKSLQKQQSKTNEDLQQLQHQAHTLENQTIRLEQQIQQQRMQQQQAQKTYQENCAQLKMIQQEQTTLEMEKPDLEQTIKQLKDQQSHLKQQLEQSDVKDIEANLKRCQQQWEQVQQTLLPYLLQTQMEQEQKLQRAQSIESLRKQLQNLQKEQQHYQAQKFEPSTELNQLQTKYNELTQKLERIRQQQIEVAQQRQRDAEQLEQHKQRLTQQSAQHAALKSIESQHHLHAWLKQHQLEQCPRLADLITVEPGWELAVECVLQSRLSARLIEPDRYLSFEGIGDIFFITQPPSTHATHRQDLVSLTTKIKSPWPLNAWLDKIYIAQDLNEAQESIKHLDPHESIVTRSGIWLGTFWIYYGKHPDDQSHLLARKQKLVHLEKEIEQLKQTIKQDDETYAQCNVQYQQITSQHDQYQKQILELKQQESMAKAKQHLSQERNALAQQQLTRINQGIQKTSEQLDHLIDTDQAAQANYIQAQQQRQQLKEQQNTLTQEKNDLQNQLEAQRKQRDQLRTQTHHLELTLQSKQLNYETLQKRLARLSQEYSLLAQKNVELERSLSETVDLTKLESALETLRQKQRTTAQEQQMQQTQLQQFNDQYQEQLQQQERLQQTHEQDVRRLEQIKLQQQEALVRAETLREQIPSQTLEEIAKTLTPQDQVGTLEKQLQRYDQRLEEIGAVNLIAYQEYMTIQARSEQLNRDCQDLSDAIAALEQVIQKIDQETAQSFQSTLTVINQNFQNLFNQLFGSGQAEIHEQDGNIFIMAQPPGKRTTRLQLLSGGEKALTGIALIFALFQLNPAPFCILDEVDAPLDDVNVERFCALVQSMSEKIQCILVSHNKLVIEKMHQLIGVTMPEAGISQLVSVDIESILNETVNR
jgi:chromosome segregation protein